MATPTVKVVLLVVVYKTQFSLNFIGLGAHVTSLKLIMMLNVMTLIAFVPHMKKCKKEIMKGKLLLLTSE